MDSPRLLTKKRGEPVPVRDYAKISPRFWIGDTGRKLRSAGPSAQVLALYLLTSPHANMLGLYYLPIAYIEHELGLTRAAAREALDQAIEALFCAYDDAAEVVWVFEMARFQVGEQLEPSDKRCKGVQKEYLALPANDFLGVFFDMYSKRFHLSAKREERKPGASPIEAPSKPLRSQEQEQEQEQEHEQDLPFPGGKGVVGKAGPPAPAPAPIKAKIPSCPHEQIIAAYHELLPSCSRVREWNTARQGYLRSRWREKAKPNGVTQGYETTEAGLAWWRKFFAFVGESQFLTGRAAARRDRPPFVADLEWLLRPTNFAKVIEGKYHDGA